MPIYEYACPACDQTFEAFIIRRSDEAEVACPRCQTPEVTRIMSRTAAVRAGGGGDAGAPAPSCGPIG